METQAVVRAEILVALHIEALMALLDLVAGCKVRLTADKDKQWEHLR